MVTNADIEQQYERHPDLKKADVLAFLDWADKQPHLPKLTELDAALILHSCYCSNEAAKECADNYFTCRTHVPEFFANLDPKSKELQSVFDSVYVAVLPKLTPKGEVVLYLRLNNTNPDVYSFNAAIKMMDMFGLLYMRENGCFNGHVIVIDLEGLQLMHVIKTSVLSMKKYMFYLQDCLPFRLQGLHYVNGVSFMDKILALIKPFLKKDLQNSLHVHYGNNETILKFVPKECLPNECGGSYGSVKDIYKPQRKHVEENAAFFAEEEKRRVDESRRPGKPKNAGDLFGVEGTFKKLDID